MALIYGRTLPFDRIQGFVEIKVHFSHAERKLMLEWIEKSQEDRVLNKKEWSIILLKQAESCRYYQGNMRASDNSRLIV